MTVAELTSVDVAWSRCMNAIHDCYVGRGVPSEHGEKRLHFLIELVMARRPHSILEIGLDHGFSATAFIAAAPNARFLAMDSACLADTMAWTKKAGFALTVIRQDSRDPWPPAIAEQRWDLIHVDGDHSYEGVYSDLCKASEVLSPWGLILAHDLDEANPGVRPAVERFLKEREGQWEYTERHDIVGWYGLLGRRAPA